MTWLRKLTIDQWSALVRDYPVRSGTPREQTELLGMFLVSALVLMLGEYAADDLWRLLPWEMRTGSIEWRYWRKLGWVVGVTLAYVVPPTLYAWFVLEMTPRDLGLNGEGFVKHLPLYFAFFGIVVPFVAWFSGEPHFQNTYPLSNHASESVEWLAMWEICYGIQFVGLEYFFRGFMLFAGARLLGPWVIPVMVVPYCMLHFAKPWPETLGSIIAGTTLGVMALRTRSVLAGVCIHIAVAWSMDFMALWRSGDLHRLFGS